MEALGAGRGQVTRPKASRHTGWVTVYRDAGVPVRRARTSEPKYILTLQPPQLIATRHAMARATALVVLLAGLAGLQAVAAARSLRQVRGMACASI